MAIVTDASAGPACRGATPAAPAGLVPAGPGPGAPPRPRAWRRGLRAIAVWALAGCGGDSFQPAKPLPPDQVYWTLELNHRAVTLSTSAPGKDTLTLVATARTADGTPLTDLPPVEYVSRDPERIVVTQDGLLQAVQPTGGQVVAVVATLTADNLKHVDSVLVVAVDNPTPPVFDSFSIQPTPPDSAKAGALGTCFVLPQVQERPSFCSIPLPVTLLDAAGAPITPAVVAIRSGNPNVLFIAPDGMIFSSPQFIGPETATLYASATVFGVRRADTLPFRLGWPVAGAFALHDSRVTITIGVGGVAFWLPMLSHIQDTVRSVIDITFDDPTNVVAADLSDPGLAFFTRSCASEPCFNGSGNIVIDGLASPIIGSFKVFRRFPMPGVYDYHSTALGTSGRIVVKEE